MGGLGGGLACSAAPRPAAVAALGATALYGLLARRPSLALLAAALVLAGLGLGQARLAAIDQPGARLSQDQEVRAEAIVRERPRADPFGWSLELGLRRGARVLGRVP